MLKDFTRASFSAQNPIYEGFQGSLPLGTGCFKRLITLTSAVNYIRKPPYKGGALDPNFSVKSQESGVRSQESEVRSQESGVRSQESGVRSQGDGVSHKLITVSVWKRTVGIACAVVH